MAHVVAGVIRREIDVVVLDKDGTLTDFHFAWGSRYTQCVAAVVEAARGDGALRAALYRALGINPADGRFLHAMVGIQPPTCWPEGQQAPAWSLES